MVSFWLMVLQVQGCRPYLIILFLLAESAWLVSYYMTGQEAYTRASSVLPPSQKTSCRRSVMPAVTRPLTWFWSLPRDLTSKCLKFPPPPPCSPYPPLSLFLPPPSLSSSSSFSFCALLGAGQSNEWTSKVSVWQLTWCTKFQENRFSCIFKRKHSLLFYVCVNSCTW